MPRLRARAGRRRFGRPEEQDDDSLRVPTVVTSAMVGRATASSLSIRRTWRVLPHDGSSLSALCWQVIRSFGAHEGPPMMGPPGRGANEFSRDASNRDVDPQQWGPPDAAPTAAGCSALPIAGPPRTRWCGGIFLPARAENGSGGEVAVRGRCVPPRTAGERFLLHWDRARPRPNPPAWAENGPRHR